MLKHYWLATSEDRLVELHSGRHIEVRTSAEGDLGVWLCGAGRDALLFAGPEARDYLAGLARILGAATPEAVLRSGL